MAGIITISVKFYRIFPRRVEKRAAVETAAR